MGDYQDEEELIFSASDGPDFQVFMEYCLIRSENEDFNINNNILDIDPDFPQFIEPSEFNYQLDTLSPAMDQGTTCKLIRIYWESERCLSRYWCLRADRIVIKKYIQRRRCPFYK